VQAALDELDRLEKLIQAHNSNPPDPTNLPAVLAYNAQADYYNSWAAQLHGKLDSTNTQYTPATTAKTAQIPSWTQPAPETPVHQAPPANTQSTPPLIDKVPLQTDLRQVEEKYSQHANDFGVNDPRGRAGFDKFDSALKQLVDDPDTLHIQGTYRGQPAILNYNPDSGLCVIQSPDGRFISGWKLSPGQVQNVLTRGSL
jgi:Colicin D